MMTVFNRLNALPYSSGHRGFRLVFLTMLLMLTATLSGCDRVEYPTANVEAPANSPAYTVQPNPNAGPDEE